MSKINRENSSLRTTREICSGNGKMGLRRFDGDDGLYRSKYEAAFAIYLKELGIKFEFEKYGEPIINITDTRLHYIPDFYLPEYNCYIEIVNTMSSRLQNKMYLYQQQNKNSRLIVLDKQHIVKMFNSEFNIYDILGKKKKRKYQKNGGIK
jgi:hypothetical protein